jgi:hypothetical protein
MGQLTTLYLGSCAPNAENNQIGEGGCLHLSKASCKALKTLSLGILSPMQVATASEQQDTAISLGHTGRL